MQPELAQLSATVALNLALALAVGAALSSLWMAPRTSAWARARAARVRRAGLAALVLAIVANAAVLWLEAATMAEVPLLQAGAAVRPMLTATHFGTAWSIGTGALVAGLLATASAGARTRPMAWVSVIALAACLYTRSMASHAAAGGDFSAPMIADWLHLMCICAWLGELFVAGLLTLVVAPGERQEDRDDCARHVEALSTAATFALAGIVATGVFSAWHNLGSPSALAGSGYGATLLLKLALVALAVALGGANRFFVMPGLIAALRQGAPATTSSLARFVLILRIEAAVLLGVLILAAVLSSTPPPASLG